MYVVGIQYHNDMGVSTVFIMTVELTWFICLNTSSFHNVYFEWHAICLLAKDYFSFLPSFPEENVDKTYWISNEGWSSRKEGWTRQKLWKNFFFSIWEEKNDRYLSSQPHFNPCLLKMLSEKSSQFSLVLIMWMANLFNACCCFATDLHLHENVFSSRVALSLKSLSLVCLRHTYLQWLLEWNALECKLSKKSPSIQKHCNFVVKGRDYLKIMWPREF